MYKDEKSGIEFGTWAYTADASSEDDPGFGAYTFGMALPEDALTKDANEYIGILVGLSHVSLPRLAGLTDLQRRDAPSPAPPRTAGAPSRMACPDR